MKKLILSISIATILAAGCKKESNLVQPTCETITKIEVVATSPNGNSSHKITLASGKEIFQLTRLKVGDKYCYN